MFSSFRLMFLLLLIKYIFLLLSLLLLEFLLIFYSILIYNAIFIFWIYYYRFITIFYRYFCFPFSFFITLVTSKGYHIFLLISRVVYYYYIIPIYKFIFKIHLHLKIFILIGRFRYYMLENFILYCSKMSDHISVH